MLQAVIPSLPVTAKAQSYYSTLATLNTYHPFVWTAKHSAVGALASVSKVRDSESEHPFYLMGQVRRICVGHLGTKVTLYESPRYP